MARFIDREIHTNHTLGWPYNSLYNNNYHFLTWRDCKKVIGPALKDGPYETGSAWRARST